MQPHSVGRFGYRSRMQKRPDPRAVLWRNVVALMHARYGKENLTRLSKDAGIGPGTASRLKAQDTYAQLDTIDKLADLFDLAPWQLLVPGLEPGNPPVLRDAGAAERRLYEKFLKVKRVLEENGSESASE